MKAWIEIALSPDVVRRSIKVGVLVGTILIAINYGDRLLTGSLAARDWIKMALTYLVPYSVSTYASVSALMERNRP